MGAPVLAETQMLDWLAASQPGMERLLSRLVDIDSPSGHDEGLNLVADELAAFLEQNGVDVRRIPSGSGTPLLQAMTGTRVAGMPVVAWHLTARMRRVGSDWPFNHENLDCGILKLTAIAGKTPTVEFGRSCVR